MISIHSLRVEGDTTAHHGGRRGGDFNPLPPCGGRLRFAQMYAIIIVISIHSLRVEGDVKVVYDIMTDTISIHSLRVEGDLPTARSVEEAEISIHSLRVEGDATV